MAVLGPSPGGDFEVDACPGCRIVWFDRSEYEQMPRHARPQAGAAPAEPDEPSPDQAAAMSLRDTLALVGFPTEQHASTVWRRPLLTWGLAAVLLCALLMPRELLGSLAFSPDDPWRLGGLSLVTSLLHQQVTVVALFTIWLLLIVGDNVEDALGRLALAGLVLVATVGANLTWLGLGGPAPACGSVPAVWAMATFYVCCWPMVRLGFNIYGRWVSIPLYQLLATVLGLVLMTSLSGWIGESAYKNLSPEAVKNATRSLSSTQTVTVVPMLSGLAAGGLAWLLYSARMGLTHPQPD